MRSIRKLYCSVFLVISSDFTIIYARLTVFESHFFHCIYWEFLYLLLVYPYDKAFCLFENFEKKEKKHEKGRFY